jgi:acyl-CoA thioester hydrolase
MTVHRHRFRVRYGETDQMGYVHHSVYLLYFEEGRTGLMRELGCSYAEMERKGHILPVVETRLRFLSPARFDEELVTESRVSELTGVRVRFDYRVLHASDGSPVAEGWTMLASCDSAGRPKRMPRELSELLRAAMAPGSGCPGAARQSPGGPPADAPPSSKG